MMNADGEIVVLQAGLEAVPEGEARRGQRNSLDFPSPQRGSVGRRHRLGSVVHQDVGACGMEPSWAAWVASSGEGVRGNGGL